jgi:hypothetical protein
VDKSYDPEDAALANVGQKRKHAEMTAEEAREERHGAWVDRGRRATGECTWRPRKLHRTAAKKWCGSLDLQVRRPSLFVIALLLFSVSVSYRLFNLLIFCVLAASCWFYM